MMSQTMRRICLLQVPVGGLDRINLLLIKYQIRAHGMYQRRSDKTSTRRDRTNRIVFTQNTLLLLRSKGFQESIDIIGIVHFTVLVRS